MLKKLDRYIIGKYIGTFLFTIFLFVMIFVVIDYTEKNDDFISEGIPFHEVIFSYYINYIPYLANYLSPIIIFVSTVYVTARLASHTEIIAMLSSGMSFLRVLQPYFVGALFLAILIFVMQGWVLPHANKQRVKFEKNYLEHITDNGKNYTLKVSEHEFIKAQSFIKKNNRCHLLVLDSIVDKKILKHVVANIATYDKAQKAWMLKEYLTLRWNGEKYVLHNGMHADTIMKLPLKLSDFKVQFKTHETLTIGELEDYIQESKAKGKETKVLEMYKHERYAYPFAIVILTMMAVIVSARKSREGVGAQIALGLVLALAFVGVVYVGKAMAEYGTLSPMIVAWGANIIFAGITVVLYKTVPR